MEKTDINGYSAVVDAAILKENLDTYLNLAIVTKKPILVTRNGQPVAALLPLYTSSGEPGLRSSDTDSS